jgi:V8-like Glu-specific endopeptidase
LLLSRAMTTDQRLHRIFVSICSATLMLGATACQREGFDGRVEDAVDFAETHGAALRALDPATHDLDDIEKGRIEAPAPTELDAPLLALVERAASFSEAIALVRVAGQIPGDVPPVPNRLSNNASDPDFEFAGRNVVAPYAVQKALRALRDQRDAAFEALDAEAREAEGDHLEAESIARRARIAARLGWRFDSRPDLYVVDAGDGTIWRRKVPDGYVRSDVREGPSHQGPVLEEEGRDVPVELRAKIIGGSDDRDLRSRQNGYSMTSAVWQPKGTIVDDGRTTQEVPVEVDCSGTKISARLVSTAGHCMFKNGSWNDNTKWIPGADGIDAEVNGRDPSPSGYKNRWTRVVRGNWFDDESAAHDFGVFVLYDNSSSCTLYWHGWREYSSLWGKSLYLYGFPGEGQQCSDSPLAGGTCHGSIYGDGGSISWQDSNRIYYTMDSSGGMSGSGVYEIDGGSRYVVAVHRGGNSTWNNAVRINGANTDLIQDATSDYPANACN